MMDEGALNEPGQAYQVSVPRNIADKHLQSRKNVYGHQPDNRDGLRGEAESRTCSAQRSCVVVSGKMWAYLDCFGAWG